MRSSPVAHHNTIKLPGLFENLIEKYGIVAVVLIFVEIICSHDTPSLALCYGSLEGRKIYLVQGAIADDDIYLMAIFLIVVQGIVLHTSSNTLRLHSLDIRHHHTRCEIGVFTHIFEIASVEWSAVDIHSRTEYHVLATIKCFLAKALAVKQ